ncbi:uncharacterized protein TNIN_371541 [Trichonephila inaurata madagascariensis]|uniref:Uncharacterized protein n=1 Tax=Trichonephila inaurata madagascariensis TaxID=2747483 RepID=A0A8X6X736_9ARAC|nr:uncharacterized protein TNIN_371541 [Trichonephila inaurata madagascariensis]
MCYIAWDAVSLSNTVQFEISIAYHPQSRILSSESGALVQYVGDNANINVHTLDVAVTRHLDSFLKKGGKTFIRILENLPNLDQLAQVFQEENCPVQALHENGVRVLLAIYNALQSENNIDNLRYTQFIMSTKLNKPVQLSNIPPTRAAALQHISRVYYQVQTWLGNHLEPQEEGWILRNSFLEPIMTILPPAPDELFKTIYCNCKNSCGSRCGCKKSGCNILQLVASIMGKLFSRYESDLYEDCTFDPEILQDLETNILDDEKNENELEILE